MNGLRMERVVTMNSKCLQREKVHAHDPCLERVRRDNRECERDNAV